MKSRRISAQSRQKSNNDLHRIAGVNDEINALFDHKIKAFIVGAIWYFHRKMWHVISKTDFTVSWRGVCLQESTREVCAEKWGNACFATWIVTRAVDCFVWFIELDNAYRDAWEKINERYNEKIRGVKK